MTTANAEVEPAGLLAPISDKARRAAPVTPDFGLPPENTPINQFEVRGYEVAQLMPDGSWRCVYRLRETEMARKQGVADVKWFNSRGHQGVYTLRALVSAPLPAIPEEVDDGPLVLEADEQSTPTAEAVPNQEVNVETE